MSELCGFCLGGRPSLRGLWRWSRLRIHQRLLALSSVRSCHCRLRLLWRWRAGRRFCFFGRRLQLLFLLYSPSHNLGLSQSLVCSPFLFLLRLPLLLCQLSTTRLATPHLLRDPFCFSFEVTSSLTLPVLNFRLHRSLWLGANLLLSCSLLCCSDKCCLLRHSLLLRGHSLLLYQRLLSSHLLRQCQLLGLRLSLKLCLDTSMGMCLRLSLRLRLRSLSCLSVGE
mmetsp:Transcript_42278/g.111677  ORF Transcript_42278/g.111677 Transcript_42278/m.111677 type:complete len:225 (-) Transcript_42278:2035-2709(-)